MNSSAVSHLRLQDGATVAIIGGGPAGSFSAIQLLQRARHAKRSLRVVIFERRCHPAAEKIGDSSVHYSGCPQCAGGISPRLHEAIAGLGITLPGEVIQSRISKITVHGNWKSIYLPVPADRPMSAVFRGVLPFGQHPYTACFDGMLLDVATRAGAEVIGSRVISAHYDSIGKVQLGFLDGHVEKILEADFAIFAGGVNEKSGQDSILPTTMELFKRLQPAYIPPRLRKALIFELEIGPDKTLDGELHYLESSADTLQLEMCSVMYKGRHITVSLIGRSIDESTSHQQNLNVIRDFLALPQTVRVLPAQLGARVCCICNPQLVVGTSEMPFGSRIAAVGDMATSRQYKDGMMAAYTMASSVVETLIERGIDSKSLAESYGRTITDFQKENRYATIIYAIYRSFFSSPSLSRIIYQAFVSEKKTKTEQQRRFKQLFWDISSGDRSYEDIAWSMLSPSTIWLILKGGIYTTLRNWLTERIFGIHWAGIPRVMTGVSRDDLQQRREELLPHKTWGSSTGSLPEFECIYSVRLRTHPDKALALLSEFGEKSRPYLNPRWVSIRRIAGKPLQQGNVIEYRILWGLMTFSIEQQASPRENLILYKVRGGFAHDGLFCFELNPLSADYCLLTIYLVFDYARGKGLFSQIFWRTYRLLFPEYLHDVLWNHALCKFKQVVESRDNVSWQVHI